MKSAEERTQFKAHFYKLGQGRLIPFDDLYWLRFETDPDCTNDVFEVLSAADVRSIRDQNLPNFALLIHRLSLLVVSRSATLNHRELLNLMRVLTKILPIFFELGPIVELKLFWSRAGFDPLAFTEGNRDVSNNQLLGNVPPLGAELLKRLVSLLFTKGFTLSETDTLRLWEPGVASMNSVPRFEPVSAALDSNRTETLRLLLTLFSTSFYLLPSTIVTRGNQFLTVLVTTTSRMELLTLVCSLLNLVCRSSNPSSSQASGLNSPNGPLNELRHLCVTYSAQLLTTLIVYPLPSVEGLQFLFDLELLDKEELSPSSLRNMARVYFGKLHKEQEIIYLATSLMDILRAPMDAVRDAQESYTLSLFTGSPRRTPPSPWVTSATMLLWELFQCNKTFRKLMYERYVSEVVILLLYHVYTYHTVLNLRNFVRICTYFILYISSDLQLTEKLCVVPFDEQLLDALPKHFITSSQPTTVRDLIVIHSCNLLFTMTGGVVAQATATTAGTQQPTTNSPSFNSNQLSAFSSSPIPPSSAFQPIFRPTARPTSDVLITTLVEILYNLIPVINSTAANEPPDIPSKKIGNSNPSGGLSYVACSLITQVIQRFSVRSFLLEKSFHADLLALIVRAVCTAVVKHPKPSRMLLFNILKNEKAYDLVWNTIYSFKTEFFSGSTLVLGSINDEELASETNSIIDESGDDSSIRSQGMYIHTSEKNSMSSLDRKLSLNEEPHVEEIINEEDDYSSIDSALRPKLPTGMSLRAKEKLPRDAPLKRSWGGNDSLRIILTIILPHLKLALKEVWSGREGSSIDTFTLIKYIENTDFDALIEKNKRQINGDFLPTVPIETLKFIWSHISLGWYLSLLYGDMYNAVDNVRVYTGNNNKFLKNISTSLATFSKLTSVWGGGSKNQAQQNGGLELETIIEISNRTLTTVNHWANASIVLFKIQPTSEGFFAKIGAQLGGLQQAQVASMPGTPRVGSVDMPHTLTRRLSDFRLNNGSRTSISSSLGTNGGGGGPGSALSTPIEEQTEYFSKRSSVTSLHSMNMINRSRTNTPRNSISIEAREDSKQSDLL